MYNELTFIFIMAHSVGFWGNGNEASRLERELHCQIAVRFLYTDIDILWASEFLVLGAPLITSLSVIIIRLMCVL